MTTMSTTNFCDPTTYDDPWDLYRWMREFSPVHRDEANGIWVVSRYEDVFDISRDTDRWTATNGVRPRTNAPLSLLCEDDPEHTRQRRMINRGFTPRRVRELTPHIRALSNEIIDEMAHRGEIDFVEDFAIHVPLIVICELMGLDPETRLKMYRWSDDMMAADGHDDPDDPVLQRAGEAFLEYSVMCAALIADRRASPRDDLISILTEKFDEGGLGSDQTVDVHGRPIEAVSGEAMEDDELNMFLTVLLIAGNETTRNAISGGLLALSRFPDERQRLLDSLDDDTFVDLSVDELIRWVSPVIGFTRTCTEAHLRHGTRIEAGDEVLMLYQSANRDETVFDRPDDLVLDRDPNPHLAFGIGPHFCLGANLARLEVKLVFQELFRRLPDIAVPADATRERAAMSLVIGLSHLPAVFSPVSP